MHFRKTLANNILLVSLPHSAPFFFLMLGGSYLGRPVYTSLTFVGGNSRFHAHL